MSDNVVTVRNLTKIYRQGDMNDGYMAEIAPEASRQKGTLQVKVQIGSPDKFLTPELSARVDFIGQAPASSAAR